MGSRGWYLVIHQLPSKPIYLRARIGRLLSRLGALTLKNSVYVLPRRSSSPEDLGGLVDEVRAAGGQAYVCEADFIEGIDTEALVRRFREERAADYETLSAEIREAEAALDRRNGIRPPERELLARLTRLRKRYVEISAIDFHAAPGRKNAEASLDSLEKRLRRSKKHDGRSPEALAQLKNRVWVTRRGIQIDRIASAWLIRRFIDPNATFRFIDPKEDRRPGELRFDMVGGDFTHEGDACTFETLTRAIGSRDAALRQVAEIVHDVDIKDGKFGRADAAGVQQVLLGIVLACPEDGDRLRRGFGLFDDLYASFQRRQPLAKEAPR